MHCKTNVCVIGGGASGLVTAILCAKAGKKVTIIEQKDRIGKKILATGNGKCNLTNETMNVHCFYGENPKFAKKVLEAFSTKDTLDFFDGLGLPCKSKNGYFYPFNEQASAVLDVLRMELDHLNIDIKCNEKAEKIEYKKNGFQIKTTSHTIEAAILVLSAGGKAYPSLGSDGSGFALAKQMGHSLIPTVPALTGLIGSDPFYKQIAGVRQEGNVKLYMNHKLVKKELGEIQFTNYGISGIPVFQLSRIAGKALLNQEEVICMVDLLPYMTNELCLQYISQKIENSSYKTVEEQMIGLLNKKLILPVLKMAGIPHDKVSKKLTQNEINHLTDTIKNVPFHIKEICSYDQAQVTAGGISTNEINPLTMESKLQRNLYFTGEIIDVDGICGGYNLQWAWSTAYVAAASINSEDDSI